jgi:hypothetical protein
MSLEVYGDGGDQDEGGFTEDRVQEIALSAAQVMREMLARFVEVESPTIAESIRANWIPTWGKDPGKWEGPIPSDIWQL